MQLMSLSRGLAALTQRSPISKAINFAQPLYSLYWLNFDCWETYCHYFAVFLSSCWLGFSCSHVIYLLLYYLKKWHGDGCIYLLSLPHWQSKHRLIFSIMLSNLILNWWRYLNTVFIQNQDERAISLGTRKSGDKLWSFEKLALKLEIKYELCWVWVIFSYS